MFDSEPKETKKKLKGKGLFGVMTAVVLTCVTTLATVGGVFTNNMQLVGSGSEQPSQLGVYDPIEETDDGSNVKFSAFFAKDLDGDGYAEKYHGVCNPLDKKQNLWFEINIQADGTLHNGKISINGANFDLETMLVRDETIKQDYISKNTKTIELNDMSANGTGATANYKLLNGTITKNIGNNARNYSRNDNKVTLTGTWVSSDGSRTEQINKEINLTVDWYGKTATTTYPWITTSHYIESTLSNEYVTLSFDVGYRETAEELLLQKQVTEVDIPYYNGYAATEVKSTSQNCTYEYVENEEGTADAGKLTITREATVDSNGNITKSVSRDNVYTVQVKYPIESYPSYEPEAVSDEGEEEDGDGTTETKSLEPITLTFPTKGYYYGFNSSNGGEEYPNPYVSSATRAWTHTWRQYVPPVHTKLSPWYDTIIGRYVYNPDTNSYRYIVSKEKALKVYDDLGLEDDEVDQYTVVWEGFSGETIENQNGFYFKETKSDEFRDKNTNYTNIKDYVSTSAIYFSNINSALGEDGWLKVYDDDTGIEILNLTSEEFNTYTSSNPYKLEGTVRKIRVETSKAFDNSYLYIYQIKQIDGEHLAENMTREQFDRQEYIYTYLTAGLFHDNTQTTSTDSAAAYYEAPVSLASFSVTPEGISNQETKNITMNITTQSSRYNEAYWKNGVFVIEMPEEILEVVINSVTSSNGNVAVSSYEVYEENGKQYIRIYTSNSEPTTFGLTINADVTADARKATVTKYIKLYAINNNCIYYRDTSRAADILDINNNGNRSEYVLYKQDDLTIIAPPSLLTSQTLSNFDDKGSEVVSPKIAILDKANNSRDARVNISLLNNYTGTVSEAVIIGKIPFKDNTFQINGGSLGSTYDTVMKSPGITLPASVQTTATVYYSENQTITTDRNNNWNLEENNWKTADEVTDWTKIKTFAINLSNHVLQRNEAMKFYYDIEIPAGTKYNEVSYSTHAIYFCLDTEDGKLRARTEVSRLGIMIAKKYELALLKYKKGTNTKVKGATYRITEGTTTRTGITGNDGLATVAGLYVDKEYTLEEIATPDSYILNPNQVKFKVTVDDYGNPQITTNGQIKGNANITNIDGKYTLNLAVEDEAKYDAKIVKTGNSGEKLKGVKYRLKGGIYGNTGRTYTTNADGEILMLNLIPGTEYRLQEIKATGYYVKQDEMSFTVNRNGNNLTITSGTNTSELRNASISEIDGVDKATVNVNFVDEKIPTYKLKIVKKDKDENLLANTQFKITSQDTGETSYIRTNAEGIAEIEGLYQYVSGKYVTGEYILQEILATPGYITDKTQIKFKSEIVSGELKVTILEGEDAIKEYSGSTDTVTFNFVNDPVFKLKKTGDQNRVLPHTKFKITDLNGYPAIDISGNPIGTAKGEVPTYLTYQTIGTEAYPWTRYESDGAWQSGNYHQGGSTSTLTSERFTIDKKSTLTFDWKLSSYTNYYMYYTIKNVNKNTTIGGNTGSSRKYGVNESNYNKLDYTTVNVELEPGTYTIAFSYYKSGSYNNGLDRAFVKNLRIDADGYYYLETDEKGEFTANLPSGMYKIIEMEVPEGYDLPENEEERTSYVGIGDSRPEETEFNVRWTKTINGMGWSDIYDTIFTTDKGYIVTGSYEGTVDINGDGTVDSTSQNSFDGLITKFNKDGNVEWHYEYPSDETTEFRSIAEGPDCYVTVGKEGRDGVIVKIDKSGTLLWKKSISGASTEELKGVEVLASGDIVITGRTNSQTLEFATGRSLTNQGLFDGFVVCYDSAGTYKWHQGIQGTNNINVTDVIKTGEGMVVSADFLGNITVGGNTITNKGSQDSILIFYEIDGTPGWYKQIGGNNEETIVRLAGDTENIWAIGGFSSNLSVPVTLNAPNTSYANGLAMQFNATTGDYIRSYSYGGSAGDDLLTSAYQTSDGGIVFGGWYSSSSFDTNKDGTNDVTSNKGLYDGIVIKLADDLETVEWTRVIQGDQFDPVYGIVELEDKSIVAVGNYDSTSLFDTDGTTKLKDVQGYMDVYMVCLGAVVTAAKVPELKELTVTNELKEFEIRTEIGENSDEERAGGTITGTPTAKENVNLVEKVKYGYNGTKQIVITPDTNYSVYSIYIDAEQVTSFSPDSNGIVRIPVFENVTENHHVRVVFEKNLSSVVVHHYLKNRSGQYTTQKLAEDDTITKKVGATYTASPRTIEGYDLEKDSGGNYKVPSNARGTIEATPKEVIYYYEELPVTLTVHHYLEGTEEKVNNIEDEVTQYYKGDTYSTSSKNLEAYKVIEDITKVVPEGAGTSGTIQQDTTVSYYYKLKEFEINTKVDEVTITRYNPNTSQTEEMQIKGGTISGDDQKPYEVVRYGEDSTKEINITPDEGYRVNKVMVNNSEISFNENSDRSVTIPKFTNVTSEKNISVEFEPITGKITVRHFIKGTTNRVPLQNGMTATDKEETGYVGDPYVTKPNEDVSTKYELVEMPDNYSGTYEEEPQTITYYYQLKPAKVIVHHYLEGTENGVPLQDGTTATDVVKDGHVDDNYTAEPLNNIDEKYEVVRTSTNTTVVMTEEPIEITFYYGLKSSRVIVHYYIKGTTNKVKLQDGTTADDIVKNGHVGDPYDTEPLDDISDEYELDHIEGETSGTMTLSNIEVTYYYKYKMSQYIVNYLEKGTNRIIHEPVYMQSEVDQIVNTYDHVIEIERYKYDSIDRQTLKVDSDQSKNIANVYYIPQGYIRINKFDNITNTPLQGAIFGIYEDPEATREIARIETNADGIARTEAIEARKTYYIKEIKAPTSYKKSNQIRQVYVKSPLD